MQDLVKNISEKLRQKGWMMVTAESCTGGMIASAITELSGSSTIFDRGFVTYSNQAKIEMLGVSPETLKQHGAVSEETAIEMAQGALENSNAEISISVTGIAGPTGGSVEKPIGLVYIGTATKGKEAKAQAFNFSNMSRQEVRLNTIKEAFKLLETLL